MRSVLTARPAAAVMGLAVVLSTLGLGGCEEITRRIDFERMIDTPRVDAFEPMSWGRQRRDQRALRHPVEGTVPLEQTIESVPLDATEIPVPVDAALLRRGRERYERLCAACHGMLGLGNPGVVLHMVLRPPPPLFEARIREQPPGRLYATIRDGYGLMPAYARWLDARDRWAVVAYLQVLWFSQSVPLDQLPPYWAERARAELAP